MKNNKFSKNKNVRLVIILAFIIGIIYLFFNYLSPKENYFKYTVEDGATMIISKSDIIEKDVEMKKQIGVLKKLRKQYKDNIILHNSMTDMIAHRSKDTNKIRILIEQFELFSEFDAENKEDFLYEVYSFLSKKENPELYIDFGIKAKELIYEYKIDNLTNKSEKLIEENAQLKNEISVLKKDIADLKIENKRIDNIYIKSKEQIVSINEILEKLKRDTATYKNTIGQLELITDELQSGIEKLQEDLKKVSPVRIEGFYFKPIGTRAKDGTYKLGSIKGLEINFTLKYNIPTSTEKEKIRIVYTIPDKNQINPVIELEEKTVIVGKEYTFNFNNLKMIKYGEGIYIVQIFHDNTSKIIPIDYKYFTVRGFLSL